MTVENLSEVAAKDSQDETDVAGKIDNLQDQITLMERFVKRRFDEISMEINATAQQVDLAEEGIANRFGEILEILGAISYHGDGTTQVNTGVELEAVIEDTEQAANTILDAADRIADRLRTDEDWHKEETREKALEQIKQDVQEILMACTFQDLTGQRIRNTLENLHLIENRLSGTLERLGISVQPSEEDIALKAEGDIPRASQDDIDSLFGSQG